MRVLLACLTILVGSAVAAQENKANIPQISVSPTADLLTVGKTDANLSWWFIIGSPWEDWCTWSGSWCVQPKVLTATDEMEFAMRWAEMPNAWVLDGASQAELMGAAKQFDRSALGTTRTQDRSTVGQGSQ